MMIEHIALYVNDLEAARTFFMKYLGAASNDGYHCCFSRKMKKFCI